MVDQHGSQCGFCTPGFVMSMVAGRKADGLAQDEHAIDDMLAGNLCRCTGYAPIVRAMRQAMEAGPDHFDAQAHAIADRLRALRDGATVELGGPAGRLTIPATGDALAQTMLADPDARIVAGATDVGLWVTKGMRDLPHIVTIGQVPDLRRIECSADGVPGCRRDVAGSACGAGGHPAAAGCGGNPPHRVRAGAQQRHGMRQHRQRFAHW